MSSPLQRAWMVLLLLAVTTPASAQVGRAARAAAVDTPPVVDGALDESVWTGAPILTDFVQRVPQDGNPASERTDVRILQDGSALYVGVWLHDSSASEIIPGESVRDYNLEQSDAIVLILDTFRDQQNAFVFGTNPAGIQYDGQVANSGQGGGRFFGGGGGGNQRQQSGSGGGFNLNWDASWDVATSRDAQGWYAEFRIPFSTLRYASGEEQVWGLNLVRRIRRLNEQSFWAPVPREFDQYRLNYAGALEGLEPPVQRVVQVTPYALQRAQRDYIGMDSYDHDTEFGGDAKVQVTQGLTLDLTYNTDFAQVEVDEVQTNLSRFNISFPEKRPFFLENAGRFSVGAGGADLFFSRRIGISEEGPVPILGGGRLSGRAAGLNVGLLHIVTDELGAVPQNEYSVVRLARELPNRSRIGGAFMRRASDETNDWNRTYAVDGQLGIGEAVSVSSFLARTETPGLDGRDHAFDVQGGYTTRAFNATLSYREVGEDFNPELGFLPRDGYRYGQVFVMSYHRPEDFFGIREIRPHTSYFEYRDIGTDFVQSARWHVDSHFEWQDGMEFHPGFNWVKEGIETPYTIHRPNPDDPDDPGVVVPAGTYDGWEAQWVFYTDESSMLSFNGGVTWGSFLSGSRVNPYGTVLFRPSSSFSASVRLDHNDVDLDLAPGVPDTFKENVVGVRLSYFLTPSISIQSLTQYADRADIWSTNVRFSWLDDAGSGLFIVFNQANGFDTLSEYSPLNRSFVIKYSKLLDVARW